MKTKSRILLVTGMVLMAALLLTGTAFAEGEAPPPEPAAEAPVEEAPPPEPVDIPPVEEPLPVEDTAPADGAVPGEPVAEPPTGELPPVEEPPAEEVPVIEIPAEEPPAEETPAEEPPVEEPVILPAEELPVEEPLADDLVLVDEAGQAVDLDSQTTAETLAAADPYFTTGGGATKYCFIATGICDGSCSYCNGTAGTTGAPITNPIQVAIDYIGANILVLDNGTLKVEKATYVGSVMIDQTTYTNLTALTKLEGQLDAGVYPTISGTLTLKNLTTSFWLTGFTVTGGVTVKDSTTTGYILVENVTGPLTLSNLDVSNAAAGGYGINVSNHKGNVTLTNVKSSGNDSWGASINNSGAAGNVTITNCAFDYNSGSANDFGIQVSSIGTVAINGLSASYNGEIGIWVQNFSNLSLKNAVLANNTLDGGYFYTTRAAPVLLENVVSQGNSRYGMYIDTAGAVTLRSVDTHGNVGSFGIKINNSTGTGSVTLSNIRTGSNPNGTGLSVISHGAITITSILADNNGIHGAYLDNCDDSGTACRGSGNVTITSTAAAGVAGANEFNENANACGLYISSKGVVTLTNVTAYGNHQSGIEISNYRGTGGVNINKNLPNWTNAFYNNVYHGIKLTTHGAVLLNDSITYGNTMNGINISGMGTITLVNVAAYDNGSSGSYSGLHITNTTGTGGVTIRSTVVTNTMDFSGNTLNGINIASKGAVSVASVNVNYNTGGSGLYIENYSHPTLSPAVTISNGQFNDNYWSGIVVYSKGAITLTNVEARRAQNSQPGVLLDNYTNGGVGAVTIRSSDAKVIYDFRNNAGEGIRILSRGAVSISNVYAYENQLDGIFIVNCNGTSDQPVTLTNVLADYNTQDGLDITARGAITLVNTGASDNGAAGYYGAKLSNWPGTALTGVTIRSTVPTANYAFSGNGQEGIFIWSEGPVSVGNVTAAHNALNGMYIRRYTGSGAVSVSHSSFDYNTQNGLLIEATRCVVTLTDVSASYNDPDPTGTNYSGVDINANWGIYASSSVTIKSSRTTDFYAYSHNSQYGIRITSTGPVSVGNVLAEENKTDGVYITNEYAPTTAPAAVSVLRSTSSGSDTGYGFHITTRGSVTLTDLTANENHEYGVYVYAYDSTVPSPANVTVNGTRNNFDENKTYGIRIDTEGAISLSNVSACGTDKGSGTSAGISLNNNYSGATAGVTISASSTGWNYACGNDDGGLEIYSRGPISIARLIAIENDGTGGMINNSYSDPFLKNITLTTCNFSWNGGSYGLYIKSKGAVALNSTKADSNESTGIHIETDGAVTFNGVSATYNSKHSETIPYTSATIYERLTSDVEGDIWYFTATQVSNTITLSSSDFDAYLILYWWNTNHWEYLTEADGGGGGGGIGDAQIIANLGIGTDYYILATTSGLATTSVHLGQPGEYTLGYNGSANTMNKEEFYGAEILNDSGTGNVTITSPSTFWSDFSENNYMGLRIATDGAVSITNTSASDNGGTGLNIEAHPTHVTIRNTSTTTMMQISNNREYGIYLPFAYGAITLSGRIFLNENGKYGANMNNDCVPIATPMSVTVSGVTANGNKDGDGLNIKSIGQVTISNVTACKNNTVNAGLYVDNSSTAARSLTINGTNIFSENTDAGLNAVSSGVISISGVRAEANTLQGIYVFGSGTGKALTLANIISQYNGSHGIEARAHGTITFTSVRSNLNGQGSNGSGILVDTYETYPIYFNTCTIIGNEGHGIYANDGTPSWLHLTGTLYFGNDSDGSGDKDLEPW